MSVVADCRTHLLTQSGITDLVGTRVYFDNLPQSATLPSIVVYQAGDDLVRHLDAADTLSRVGLQVDVYATTHEAADGVATVLINVIEMDVGTWGASTTRRAYVDSVVAGVNEPRDGSDAWRHLRILSCSVWIA